MRDINSMSRGGIRCPKTDATQYHAQLGLPDKGRTMVVCLKWFDSTPFGLA